MQSSVNEIFDRTAPHMPESLISREVMSIFKELNDRFPVSITDNEIFECPLGTDDPLSDLSLSVSAAGREIIAGIREGPGMDRSLLKSRIWKRIRSFCKRWCLQESSGNTGAMGLEFDLQSLGRRIPVPGVFIYGHVPEGKEFSCHRSDRYRWIIEGLECLKGRPLKREISDNLIHCLDAIPDEGAMDYAGLMLSRRQDLVRAVIRIPSESLREYLKVIKYPGDLQKLFDLVNELSRYSSLRYNLDISGAVRSRVGVECFPIDKARGQREKWERLLSLLVERSLCVEQKKDALMDWLGYEQVTLPAGIEPYYIFRRIDHIKVTYEMNRPLLAKAYPDFLRIPEMDLIFNNMMEKN
jgi:hypothetical protein